MTPEDRIAKATRAWIVTEDSQLMGNGNTIAFHTLPSATTAIEQSKEPSRWRVVPVALVELKPEGVE